MSRRYIPVIVVAMIVLLCAGVLFPAVQTVRRAAARMTCAAHLSQTAFAHHNYAATNGDTFAAGTIPHPDLPPEQRLSWWVSISPYVEQDTVFKQFDLTRGPGDPRNAPAASNRWWHLVCPSSGEYDRGTHQWKSPTPLTHYVGVAGVGADAAMLPLGHPRAGVFGYDRRTALKDGFPDGISNTLMLIETANDPGHWAFGGTATVRAFEPDVAPYFGPGRPFGGFHNLPVLLGTRTHACNVGFANGSYRYLTSDIAPEVLEALATVGGKEPLPASW